MFISFPSLGLYLQIVETKPPHCQGYGPGETFFWYLWGKYGRKLLSVFFKFEGLKMSNLNDRVIAIVAKKLDVSEDKITESSNFVDDLGADSLATLELVMALEEEFECEIPDDVAEKIRTVKDALDYIQANAKAT